MDWIGFLLEAAYRSLKYLVEVTRRRFDRHRLLEQVLAESRARSEMLFERVGLSKDQATRLLQVPEFGLPADIRLQDPAGFVLILGEPGVGKSLAAERIFQAATNRALTDARLVVPIWIAPSELKSSLEQVLLARIGGRKVARQGLFVVIDGIDELGEDDALSIVDQVRVFRSVFRSTTFVVTSRSLPGYDIIQDAIRFKGLDDGQALTLITWISGHKVTSAEAHHWSKPLRDSTHLPLFSIILGRILARGGAAPLTTAELLAELAETFLARARAVEPTIETLLNRLGATLLNNGSAVIRRSSFASPHQAKALVRTGLVLESEGYLRFTIPILTDWFGSRSIAEQNATATDIAGDPRREEHWKVAISIFCATHDYEQSYPVLSRFAEVSPAFLATVIESIVNRWGGDTTQLYLTPQTIGTQIAMSMSSWAHGIGALAGLIAPIDDRGEPRALAVHYKGNMVTVLWHRAGPQPSQRIQSAEDLDLRDPTVAAEWPAEVGSWPTRQPAWPWRFSLDELRTELKWEFDRHRFTRNIEAFSAVYVWRTALSLTRGINSLNESAIPLSELESHPALYDAGNVIDGHTLEPLRLDLLREAIGRLRPTHDSLLPPWPTRDLHGLGPWIWSGFSDQQLLARAEKVLTMALLGYSEIVRTWFQPMRHSLELAMLSPVRLRLMLQVRQSDDDKPYFYWYQEPFPASSQPIATGTVENTIPSIIDQSEDFALIDLTRRERPEHFDRIKLHRTWGELRVIESDAAIKLAMEWLHSDLKQTNWL